jgi:hypothetical protein
MRHNSLILLALLTLVALAGVMRFGASGDAPVPAATAVPLRSAEPVPSIAVPAAGRELWPESRVAVADLMEGVEEVPEPARVISGRINQVGGQAIAGAWIEVRLPGATNIYQGPRAQSDIDGFFELGPLPRGSVQLSVRYPGFLPFGRSYASGAEDLLVTLTPARAVFGTVIDAHTGAPIAITDAQLLVSAAGAEGPWRCLGEPVLPAPDDAATGRFRVPLGIHRYARIALRSTDHALAVSEPFFMGRDDAGPIVLRATAGTPLLGELRDDRGHPVPGAEISVFAEIGDLVQTGTPLELSRTTSRADGTFRSTPLTPGRYRIRVRRSGYLHVDQTIELDRDAAPSVQLVMARTGTIRGQLRGDASGLPPRLRVVAKSTTSAVQSGPRPRRLPSARVHDNEFVFEQLEPGRYHLQLHDLASGHHIATAQAVIEVAVGQERFVELDLERMRAVRD